jgi:hypothetical protein
MAQTHAGGEAFPPAHSRGGVATLSTALGALTALAIGAAVAWWGWGLTSRDIDEIPVVRALDGPMKRRPVDPGGMSLDTSDVSITTMLTRREERSAGLAPPRERPLDEDLPVPRLAPPSPVPVDGTRSLGPFETPTPGAPAQLSFAERLAAQRLVAKQATDAAALAAEVLADVAEAPPTSLRAAAVLAAAGPVDPPDAGPAAPRVAPVSFARPERLAELRAAETAASRAAEAAAVPRALSVGDMAVQFGAYNSAAVAAGQWARQLRRNGDLLRDFVHSVTTVRSGGQTLHRLRAGPFASLDEAKNLCEALKARQHACLPVRME